MDHHKIKTHSISYVSAYQNSLWHSLLAENSESFVFERTKINMEPSKVEMKIFLKVGCL